MNTPLCWLIQKDLVGELRARLMGAETMYLGILTAFLFGLQIRLPGEHQHEIGATLFWFAILFAGMPTLERSFSPEREDGFLDGVLTMPVRASTLYLAKLAVNSLVLAALACLLTPLWIAMLGVPLLERPAAFIVVAALGLLGFATIGTTIGALLGSTKSRTGNLTLVVLPLVLPVLLAATEATRLAQEGEIGPEWWRWVLFLAGFALVFGVSGSALFEFAVKE